MANAPTFSTSSLQYNPPYKLVVKENCNELHCNCSSWYSETVILNQTSRIIHVLDYTGKVVEIPPYYAGIQDDGGKVIISSHRTLGRRDKCIDTFKFHPNKLVTEVTVLSKELMQDAIFVPELDMALSFELHKSRLEDIHPRIGTTKKELIEKAVNDIKDSINNHTISVIANHPDPKINNLFWAVGDLVMHTPVCHGHEYPFISLSAASAVQYDVENKEYVSRRLTYTIDDTDAIFDGVDEVHLGNDTWVFGTSINKVRTMITDLRDKKEEEERQYKANLVKYTDKIAELEAEVSRLKSTIDQQKHEIKQQEYTIDRYRTNDHLIHDRVKMNSELERMDKETTIHSLKVEKEALSTKAAESAAWSTAIKAAAVIVPSAIGITLALKTVMAGIGSFLGGVWSFAKCILPFMFFL